MQPNPNEDILVDAIIDQTGKLDDIATSNDVQVEGIVKTNEKLDDLNSTAELMMVQNDENTKKIVDAVKPTKLEIEIDGADMITYKGEKGEKGDKGDKGEQGESIRGEKGDTGEKGEKGDMGYQGLQGEKGDTGKSIRGERGERGAKGEKGDTGEKGEKGDRGLPGTKGKDIDTKLVKELEEKIDFATKRASKTTSLVELDDVNLIGLTQTNGKYNLGSGGGGSSTWGSITGTLSDQTDLQSALNLKANIADLGSVAFSNDYNDLDNKPTIPTGTIDGTLTTNELVYSIDNNTVGSLAVATYPSLTELSYVKGVTSAIQTQLNAKVSSQWTTNGSNIYYNTGAIGVGGADLTNVKLNITGTQSSANNAFGLYMGGLTLSPAAANSAYFQYAGGTVATGGNTIANAFSFYTQPITKSGGGTITNTYGVYVPASTSGTNNYGAYFEGNVGITTATPNFALSFGTSLFFSGSKLALYESGGSALYGFGVTANSVDFYASGSLAAQFTGGATGVKMASGLMLGSTFVASSPPTNGLGVQGNAGFGTTVPARQVDVSGTGATATVNATELFRITRPTTGGVKWGNAAEFALGSYSTNINSESRLDLKLNNGGTPDPDMTAMTWLANGNVGIGTTAPTAAIHLKAGTATASTAPLKFTAGTALTTPEAGTFEFSNSETGLTFTAVSTRRAVVLDTATQTVTNKRVSKRVVVTTQSATPTINTDNGDIFQITGLAQAITSFATNLSGTPVAGDMMMIQITDDGTARAITWGAPFAATTVALPTTTVISTMLRVLFQRNNANTVWDCIATA